MLWTYNPGGLSFDDSSTSFVESQRGLGGGVSWALDPTLCAQLLPRFKESAILYDSLVDCRGLHAALTRAFEKWSDNSRFINFVDLTLECDKLYDPELHASGFPNEGFSRQHGGCPHAEIWVSPQQGGSGGSSRRRRELEGLPAAADGSHGYYEEGIFYIEPEPESAGLDARRLQANDETSLRADGRVPQYVEADLSVASARSYWRHTSNFRYTSGARPYVRSADGTPDYSRVFVEAYAGKLSIGTGEHTCWYLDSEFCSSLHSFKASMGDPEVARTIIAVVCWSVSAIAIVVLIFKLTVLATCCGIVSFNSSGRSADVDRDGSLSCGERCLALTREVSRWNPLGFALLLSLIIVPLTLYYEILLPCWECNDFEAAMIHEMGHFFGLDHPDWVPMSMLPSVREFNPAPRPNNSYTSLLARGEHANSTSCVNLWAWVQPGVPSGAPTDRGAGGYAVRNSVMEKFTQHNPLPCLQQDDFEALATLYPDCAPFGQTVNVCVIVPLNIGVVRTTIYVVFPLLLSLLLIVLLSSIAQCVLEDERDAADEIYDETVDAAVGAQRGRRGRATRGRRSRTREPSCTGAVVARDAKLEAGSSSLTDAQCISHM